MSSRIVRCALALVLASCGSSSGGADVTSSAATAAATTATVGTRVNTAAAVRALAWGSNVKVTVDDVAGTWTVSSNGRPDHALPDRYLLPKPGVDARTVTLEKLQIGRTPDQKVPFTWTLSLTPTLAASPTNLFGPLAVASSGAVINDPYEGDQRTIAVEANFMIDGVGFIDDCNGHFNPMGYHYHGIPRCITTKVDQPGAHSSLVGFAIDGFPVYGPNDTGGNEVTRLDACRGHVGPTREFPNGVHHYHLTSTFPYTTLCLSGTPAHTAHPAP